VQGGGHPLPAPDSPRRLWHLNSHAEVTFGARPFSPPPNLKKLNPLMNIGETNRGNSYRLWPYKFFRLKIPRSVIWISPNFHKMYTNDCALTCWDQNFDIPICFWMPACQMNDDHQIPAKSRQIFIICSFKLWSYCTDLHQNFTRCTGISVVINPHIYTAMLHFI